MQFTEVYGFPIGCEGTQQEHVGVGDTVKERPEQTVPHTLSGLPQPSPHPIQIEYCHGDLFHIEGLHVDFN